MKKYIILCIISFIFGGTIVFNISAIQNKKYKDTISTFIESVDKDYLYDVLIETDEFQELYALVY